MIAKAKGKKKQSKAISLFEKTRAKIKSKLQAKAKIAAKAKPKAAAKLATKSKIAKLKNMAKPKIKTTKKHMPKTLVTTAPIFVEEEPRKVIIPSAKPKVSAAFPKDAVAGPMGVKPYEAAPGEEYMNKNQLEHFRNILFTWREQLMQQVDRTMHNMQDDVANYADPVDRASLEEELSLQLRTRDRERKLLKKIDEAINRINDNNYGYCDDCGSEIGIRRLEARPTATQCIECKTISELREKQIGELIERE